MEQEKCLIIDGNSIMNRTFYAIKLLTTKDGTYTNACYGFLNIFYMMQDLLKPDYVAVAFDVSKPTFRHIMYDKYKAGRKSMPDELRPQMILIKDILKAMNIKILELEGYEADDILGTVAKTNSNNNIFTYILTGDRDSFQLIDKNTSIVMPSSKMGKTEYTIFDIQKLKAVYNVTPSQIIDLKSLMGDKSDNIPGVPKIGEKTAYSLLELYPTLDDIYKNVDTMDISEGLRERLISNKEIAYLSYKLATINREVPIELSYEELKLKEVNLPELSNLFIRLSFKKFLEKYGVNEKDAKLLETENSKKFFNNLEHTNFIKISDTTELENILSKTDEIVFTYFGQTSNIDKFKNHIMFKIDNNIYMVKLNSKSQNSILKAFCTSKCKKIGYNCKKLLKCFFDNGYKNPIGFNKDIMISYYLINSTENNYSIENILFNTLDITFVDVKKDAIKQQTSLFDMIENNEDTLNLDEDDYKYIYTYLFGIEKANKILEEKLSELNLNNLYNNIEIPLIETLANIESNGMYLDINKLRKFLVYLDEKIMSLSTQIFSISKEEFNINSPSQLGYILFEKLKLPVIKKTKTGYSTDKEVLEELEDKHEIVPLIIEYRTLSKLRSTYGESLISDVDSNGRIHTTFMQAVTATGRLSSVEPNLQNIPIKSDVGSKIRECFTISSNDTKIVDADYSQIELRVLAAVSKDKNMLDAFNNNKDIHSITASQVFNVDLNDVTKEMRSKAKAVNFGIVYGISDYGLSKNIHSTRKEAKDYIDKYLEHYTGVANYMEESIKIAEEQGYVKTLFERRRAIPELKSANYNTKTFGQRVAMNMPIQGTAADIMKIAMNNLYTKFKENNLKSKIVMQVHDELIVEAENSEVDIVKELLKDSMENAVNIGVYLKTDINVGNTWVDAK